MSLISEYERMLDIKNRCIAKLIKKGVPASEHEMEDFPSDIESISGGGIDVSDTTADINTVVSPKVFYDKDGIRQVGELVVNSLMPDALGVNIVTGQTYKARGDGYAIDGYNTYIPPINGRRVNAGFAMLNGAGWLYSEQQNNLHPMLLDADSRNSSTAEEKMSSAEITKDQTVSIAYTRRGTNSSVMELSLTRDGETTVTNYVTKAAVVGNVYKETMQLYKGDIIEIHTKGTGTNGTANARITVAYLG